MHERRTIADNVSRVRERIAEAATAAGRDPSTVRLVAITKYVDAARAADVVAAGGTDLGESRPQQLWEKAISPALADVQWHLVGPLQRNKVRRTLPLTSLIHSVDSQRLLAAINEQGAELGLISRVLIEVKTSGEQAKQGFSADDLRRLLPALADFPRVKVEGLMTMAPGGGDSATARASFATLRTLREELTASCPANVSLFELSMGMSGDFPEAIAEGATMVRIGSLLFEGLLP